MTTMRTGTDRLNIVAVGVLTAVLAFTAGCDSDDDKGGDYLGALVGAPKKTEEVVCKEYLKSLGTMLHAYALEHKKFPGTLEELEKYNKSRLPTCPVNGGTPYVYIPPATKRVPASTIVARDAAPGHSGKVNVLHFDGSVSTIPLAQAQSQPTTQPK